MILSLNHYPTKKHIRRFKNLLFTIAYVSTKKLVRSTYVYVYVCTFIYGNTFINHRKSLDRYTPLTSLNSKLTCKFYPTRIT